MPKKRRKGITDVLLSLKVGQSFVADRGDVGNLWTAAMRHKVKLTSRKEGDNGRVRVWRIK